MSFTPPGQDPPASAPPPPPAPPAPGWWQASDGNWYPPEAKPGVPMQYGPPGYGAPPAYGATTPYGYTPYQPSRGTNGFAIASMVLGIVWIYWIGSVLAIIFGFIAYGQIKERNQSGKGMATAGLILGFLGLGILVLAIIAVALGSSSTVKFSSVGSSIGG